MATLSTSAAGLQRCCHFVQGAGQNFHLLQLRRATRLRRLAHPNAPEPDHVLSGAPLPTLDGSQRCALGTADHPCTTSGAFNTDETTLALSAERPTTPTIPRLLLDGLHMRQQIGSRRRSPPNWAVIPVRSCIALMPQESLVQIGDGHTIDGPSPRFKSCIVRLPIISTANECE